jgi:hypothetical protein
VASECFVDGVIDDLVDEVMKTANTGIADVHTRTFTNRLETF